MYLFWQASTGKHAKYCITKMSDVYRFLLKCSFKITLLLKTVFHRCRDSFESSEGFKITLTCFNPYMEWNLSFFHSFPLSSNKIKNPLKTSSISQSQQYLIGGKPWRSVWGHVAMTSSQWWLITGAPWPHKSQTYESHSPTDTFWPGSGPIRQPHPSGRICVSVWRYSIYVLCISLSIQTSMKMLHTHTHTHTHTHWFMTDGRRMATFHVFSVQITMWTRDEFRLCHQEWTSRRWVI